MLSIVLRMLPPMKMNRTTDSLLCSLSIDFLLLPRQQKKVLSPRCRMFKSFSPSQPASFNSNSAAQLPAVTVAVQCWPVMIRKREREKKKKKRAPEASCKKLKQ